MRIILASASPRRRELLEQIGLKFEIRVSNVKEQARADSPGLLVEELSGQKAEAVLAETEQDGQDLLVIGADTVVASGNDILGKPADAEEAVRMLSRLSGAVHQVYTGVTLLYRAGRSAAAVLGEERDRVCRRTFHEMTEVSFYPMTGEEIRSYVSTGDPMDKAGAYGIQGLFARYVKGIRGDYNNVVGLPVGRLYQEAKEWLDI